MVFEVSVSRDAKRAIFRNRLSTMLTVQHYKRASAVEKGYKGFPPRHGA